jgi:membrane protease YdiL (CAAX protease family)
MLLITGIQMVTSDSSNSVWNTGKTYIGDTEFPFLAGISLMILLQVTNFTMTGIGEESLFRGVYYEELSSRYGEWPAKITDALYFTACHFPQNRDNMTAQSWSTNLLNTGLSMLTSFWLQYLYEWYGLRTAVAAHTAIDYISFFGEWLLVGGAENSTGFATNQNQNNLTISFPL